MRELEDVDTMERQVVNFLCEVNEVDVDGRWYRDDSRIRPGDNIKIRHQGERPTMWVLKNLMSRKTSPKSLLHACCSCNWEVSKFK